jgi:tetratricopeptide (TPR) repeat protein
MVQVPDDADVPLGLGDSLLHLQRYAEAIEVLRAAAQRDPENPLIYHYLASGYTAHGDLQDALVTYRRLVSLNPKDADALSNLASTLTRLDHWEDAVTYGRQALVLRPHPATAFNLGTALAELRRYEEAVRAFREALDFEPDSKETRISLALALSETGGNEAAIKLLDGLTRQRTEDDMGLVALAHVLRRAERVEEAVQVGRSAVQISEELPAAHRALGWALLKARLSEAGLESFRQALRLAPDDSDAQAGQGACLSALGHHQAAMAVFERVLAKSPDIADDDLDLQALIDATRRALSK